MVPPSSVSRILWLRMGHEQLDVYPTKSRNWFLCQRCSRLGSSEAALIGEKKLARRSGRVLMHLLSVRMPWSGKRFSCYDDVRRTAAASHRGFTFSATRQYISHLCFSEGSMFQVQPFSRPLTVWAFPRTPINVRSQDDRYEVSRELTLPSAVSTVVHPGREHGGWR